MLGSDPEARLELDNTSDLASAIKTLLRSYLPREFRTGPFTVTVVATRGTAVKPARNEERPWTNAETREKIDRFLAEVIEVSKKHGFSISHEDGQGAFVIETADDENYDWLLAAKLAAHLRSDA
jgi:hypothetical protein